MPIPKKEEAIAAKLLFEFEDTVPTHVHDRVKWAHRTEGNSIIHFEFRRRFDAEDEWYESPMAKFTYVQSRKCWKLLWMNSRLKWKTYEPLPEAATFRKLFEEVKADPYCFFRG